MYGYFKDNNPRSTNDKNEYKIDGDIGIFDIYNQQSEKISEFIVDAEDVEKIRDYKWRMSYGRIVTGNNTKTRPTLYLTHLLLDVEETDYNHKIDHIDGDPLNNRKSNLRICTQGENTLNKVRVSNNTSGIIGVHPDRRKNRKSNWCAEIRKNNIQYHIGQYVELSEAAYARYVGETILFGEYRNTSHDEEKRSMFEEIPEYRKHEISDYVNNKIKSKCVLLT